MLIRSILFSVTVCTCTYFLVKADQQTLVKVDLQKILKEKALVLSEKNLKKDAQEFEIMQLKKEVTQKLKSVAHDRNVIILTTPSFGNIQDITDDILNEGSDKK